MATPASQPLKVFCTWIQCRHGEIGSGSLSVASRPREQLAHATTLSGLRASKSDPPPLKWSRLGAGPDPPPLGSPTLALVGVRARTECERVKTIGTSLRSWGPPFAQFGQRLRRGPCQCPGAQSSDGSQGSPAPASRALPCPIGAAGPVAESPSASLQPEPPGEGGGGSGEAAAGRQAGPPLMWARRTQAS